MHIHHPLFDLSDLSSLWQSTVGIEREALRVNLDGTLSERPHYPEWGTRTHQPYIQTDFAESQLELITPPTVSARESLNWLAASHQIVQDSMAKTEVLWPFSTPGIIPEDEAAIKIAQLENPDEYAYRDYLAQVYGKHVQLLCGIHYNIQLNPELVERKYHLRAEEASNALSLKDTMNDLYMSIGRKYLQNRWLLTYLLSATPFVAPNYATKLFGAPSQESMRSFRQSRFGYHNDPELNVSYTDLESFVTDVEAAVEKGQLSLEKELYRDVRFRGQAEYRDLVNHGIQYIELRNFDLDPYHAYGISERNVEFVKLFILTLLFVQSENSDELLKRADEMNQTVAEADALAPLPFIEEAEEIFDVMKLVAQELDQQMNLDSYFQDLAAEKRAQLHQPELTISGKIFQEVQTPDRFVQYGLDIAQHHLKTYTERSYNLHGFENYELSSQNVLKYAIRAGIKVEELDPSENLLKLTYGDHSEYVRNGNMTQLDSQISYFVMENKVATKKVLAKDGIQVPAGNSFSTFAAASAYFSQLPFDEFVVKPKNTNYGLGISIFKTRPSKENYEEALGIAFDEDDTVLIEAFAHGTELRFYVQNNEVKAICERLPAHVIGDGTSTIDELVDQTNSNPLRGPKHQTPLTNILKGREEHLQLAAQNFTFDSIPEKDQIVYLRENSNISTGGISIDRTEETHQDYHDIAIKSAELLGANFCGVDIIINDFTQPVQQADDYSVIEANFNPAMMIHLFPGQGKPRELGKEVLRQLFPEVNFY